MSESTQTSQTVWFEKMFLCCFFLKAGRKDLTNRPKVLFQPPPPPPTHTHTHTQPNCSFPPEKCWIWIHEIWETPCYTAKNSVCVCVCVGGGGGGGENFRPVCQVFFSCFRGKTTQEHLFTSHRSACEVWVDSDILENFSRNGGYVVLAQSHSIIDL